MTNEASTHAATAAERGHDLARIREALDGFDAFVRACTDAELLAIYRYTAEDLHKERARTAQACHIGQAVLSAIGAGLIKVSR